MDTGRVFEDILSFRNINHWPEKFKNIKKIIACVYSRNLMPLAGCKKILDPVCAAVPAKTTIVE
jgi:hypothetical protein